jgi:hypothetical protein
LRGIENALDKKKDSNPRGNAFASWAAGTPQVVGIEVNEAMNAWRVQWNPVEITGLQKYEVQLSNDSRFSGSTSFYTRYTWFTKTDNTSTGTRYVRIRALSTSQGNGLWSATTDTTTGLVTTADISSNAIHQFVEWSNVDEDSFVHIYAGEAGAEHGIFGDPKPSSHTETYGPVIISTSEDGIVVPYTVFKMAYQSIWISVAGFSYGWNLHMGPNLAWNPSNELKLEVLRQESGAPEPVIIDTMVFDWFTAITPSDLLQNYQINNHASVASVRGYTTMDGQLDTQLLPDQPGAGTFAYSIRATVTSETNHNELDGHGTDHRNCGEAFIYFRPYYVKLRFFEYLSVGSQ